MRTSTISIIILLLFKINCVNSQTKFTLYCSDYTMIFSEHILKDSLLLFDNNTFEFHGHYMSLGLVKVLSKGRYLENDSSIVLNSYKEYRRDYEVIEKRRNRNGTKYKVISLSPSEITIIEFCDNKLDTLSYDNFQDEMISMNDSTKGFILYAGSEYVGKYFFKNTKSRYIKILMDKRYEQNYNHCYFENEKLIKKDNDLIMNYFYRIDLYKKKQHSQ